MSIWFQWESAKCLSGIEMAGIRKIDIEKFNGTNFKLWKLEDILVD